MLERTEAGDIIDPFYRMRETAFRFVRGNYEPPSQISIGAASSLPHYFDAATDEQARWEHITLVLLVHCVQDDFASANRGNKIHNMFLRTMAWSRRSSVNMTSAECLPLFTAFAARMEVLIFHICVESTEWIKDEFNKLVSRLEGNIMDFERCLTTSLPLFDDASAEDKDNWLCTVKHWTEQLPEQRAIADRAHRQFNFTKILHTLAVCLAEWDSNIGLIEQVFHTQHSSSWLFFSIYARKRA